LKHPTVLQGFELRISVVQRPWRILLFGYGWILRVRRAAFRRAVPSRFSLNHQRWGSHLVSGASHRCCTRSITQQRHAHCRVSLSFSSLTLASARDISRLCTPRVPAPAAWSTGRAPL